CRPSWPLELARPPGYRREVDIISNATLWTQAHATTTERPRTSPSRWCTRCRYRTPVARFSSDTSTSRTMQSENTVTRPPASAGTMWTSAELYFATTSQPAMQLPQKWHAGREFIGTDSVDLRTWMIRAPTDAAARCRISSPHLTGTRARAH